MLLSDTAADTSNGAGVVSTTTTAALATGFGNTVTRTTLLDGIVERLLTEPTLYCGSDDVNTCANVVCCWTVVAVAGVTLTVTERFQFPAVTITLDTDVSTLAGVDSSTMTILTSNNGIDSNCSVYVASA